MDQITGQAEFLMSLAEKSTGGVLRGDYSQADQHYVVAQDCTAYTPQQHERWRRLYRRQADLLPGRACELFIRALERLNAGGGIPVLEHASGALEQATGWRLVAVPGLVPDQVFFEHLANRRFPVTVWLREEHEFDYIVEPDLFHDFFGHVPLLFDPVYADHMQAYGKGGLRALQFNALEFIARLYWYTVEFGLIESPQGLRAYGAGILSSGAEIDYCLRSPDAQRLPFRLERVMRTLYKIDSFQQSYFVIRDFSQLLQDTAPDFEPIYARLHGEPPLAADTLLPDEAGLLYQGPLKAAGDS